jgi:acyl dehydratase
MPVINPQELAAHIGKEIGVSRWIEVEQDRIDVFAEVTEDPQFIHIDPERAAAETPFGGTIAHGFLSLSLASAMAIDVAFGIEGSVMGINYGFDKIRFLQPVRAGKRVRGRFTLESAIEKKPGQWLLKQGLIVEIEGEDKPALIAQWLTMSILGGDN